MNTLAKIACLFSVVLSGAAQAQQKEQKLYPDDAQFGSTRLFYWGADHSAGHCVINHGQPPWDASRFGKALAAEKFLRWRFGRNHWTTLDCDVQLEFKGGPTIPPGHYFLALDRQRGRFGIVFLDPKRIRPRHLDSYQAHLAVGGTFVPVDHSVVKDIAKRLTMRLRPSGKDDGHATLAISFGPHRLSTGFAMPPRRRRTTLPDVGVTVSADTQWILEHAATLHLFALDPEGAGKGEDDFHDHRITGRAKLEKNDAKRRLLGLVYRGIADHANDAANCFVPRHGIRARIGHLTVDLVICYECKRVQIYRGDTESPAERAGTSNGIAKDINAIFASLGLKIAK